MEPNYRYDLAFATFMIVNLIKILRKHDNLRRNRSLTQQ